MPTAKLCLECGGLKFSIEYEARAIKSVTTVYSIDGAGYLDAEDTDEDYGDDNGYYEPVCEPACYSCDSRNLLDLGGLDPKQLLRLLEVPDASREVAARKMLAGEDPFHESKPRKRGTLIGERIVQT